MWFEYYELDIIFSRDILNRFSQNVTSNEILEYVNELSENQIYAPLHTSWISIHSPVPKDISSHSFTWFVTP